MRQCCEPQQLLDFCAIIWLMIVARRDRPTGEESEPLLHLFASSVSQSERHAVSHFWSPRRGCWWRATFCFEFILISCTEVASSGKSAKQTVKCECLQEYLFHSFPYFFFWKMPPNGKRVRLMNRVDLTCDCPNWANWNVAQFTNVWRGNCKWIDLKKSKRDYKIALQRKKCDGDQA